MPSRSRLPRPAIFRFARRRQPLARLPRASRGRRRPAERAAGHGGDLEGPVGAAHPRAAGAHERLPRRRGPPAGERDRQEAALHRGREGRRPGEALYQLDDGTYRADHESAKAALERAQATLTSARLNATRAQELAKQDAMSKQDLEKAVAALDQAQAELKAAQAASQRSGRGARLRADLVSDLGAGRQVLGHPGRAGDREPAHGAHHRAAARSDLRGPHPVERRAAPAAQGARRREPRAVRRHPGDDRARGRQRATSTRASSRSRTSPSTRTPAASGSGCWCRTPTGCSCPACTCGRGSATGCARTACSCRSRASRAIRRATRPRSSSARTSKVEVREVKASRTVGDQWLVDAGLAAGDRVIVEGLQKVQPGHAGGGEGSQPRPLSRLRAELIGADRWHASSSTDRSSPGCWRSSSCSPGRSRSPGCRSRSTRRSLRRR